MRRESAFITSIIKEMRGIVKKSNKGDIQHPSSK